MSCCFGIFEWLFLFRLASQVRDFFSGRKKESNGRKSIEKQCIIMCCMLTATSLFPSLSLSPLKRAPLKITPSSSTLPNLYISLSVFPLPSSSRQYLLSLLYPQISPFDSFLSYLLLLQSLSTGYLYDSHLISVSDLENSPFLISLSLSLYAVSLGILYFSWKLR